MEPHRSIQINDSLPLPLRNAALFYATDLNTEGLGLSLIEAFGIGRVGDEAHRRSVWLCVLAARRVLYGWEALECEGDVPAQAVDAAANWVQTGIAPPDWRPFCIPAEPVRNGRIITDCDACRAEPIALAAAHTASFVTSAAESEAADTLFAAWCAVDEGIHWPDSMPFEPWIAVVALPAAYDLRPLTEHELRL